MVPMMPWGWILIGLGMGAAFVGGFAAGIRWINWRYPVVRGNKQ